MVVENMREVERIERIVREEGKKIPQLLLTTNLVLVGSMGWE